VTRTAAETSAAPPSDQPLLCGGCGFDLRAATADRCPECGRRFDPGHLITALIPWEQRKYIGRVRAYITTVLLVTFLPWRVADKVAMPVSLRDAQRFQRVSVLIGFTPLLGLGLLMRPWVRQRFAPVTHWRDEWARLLANDVSFWLAAAGLLLGIGAAARVGAPFFRPRGLPEPRRQRAAAVANYSSAALAWAPLAVAVSAVTVFLYQLEADTVPAHRRESNFAAAVWEQFAPFALGVAAAVGAACLWSTLALMKRATACGWGRIAAAAAVLPPAWAGLILITPLVLELIAAFVALVWLSVR
jgi:hypothetical protein